MTNLISGKEALIALANGQDVRLMSELKTLAENQKPDYLTERRKVK